MAWSERCQVWEATTNLTVYSIRIYLFNALLLVTYSHPSKPSSKSSTIDISRLDSASCLHCLALCISSEKIPILGNVFSAVSRALVWAPIAHTVCPIETICRTVPGPQPVCQSTCYTENYSASFFEAFLGPTAVQYVLSFHNSSHNFCLLKVCSYPLTKHWGWLQHGLDLLPVLPSESLSAWAPVSFQVPVLNAECWWQMDLHFPGATAWEIGFSVTLICKAQSEAGAVMRVPDELRSFSLHKPAFSVWH